MAENENEALPAAPPPEANSEDAPLSGRFATLEDLLKNKSRPKPYKDVWIRELSAYFRVIGISFGHQQRIREKCVKTDPDTGVRTVDEARLRIFTILECTIQPKLEIKDYQLLEELTTGSVGELMTEIENLSGLSKVQNLERAFKIAAALERGDMEKLQKLLGVNFSKPPEKDSKTATAS